jgi:hypothetical protein
LLADDLQSFNHEIHSVVVELPFRPIMDRDIAGKYPAIESGIAVERLGGDVGGLVGVIFNVTNTVAPTGNNAAQLSCPSRRVISGGNGDCLRHIRRQDVLWPENWLQFILVL